MASISNPERVIEMLPDYIRENLNECSKEQLIFLIEKYWSSEFNIDEICVNESKANISASEAVNRIRIMLTDIPYGNNSQHFEAYVEYAMGKITMAEYRKRLQLDD